jgi:hypothetical protein
MDWGSMGNDSWGMSIAVVSWGNIGSSVMGGNNWGVGDQSMVVGIGVSVVVFATVLSIFPWVVTAPLSIISMHVPVGSPMMVEGVVLDNGGVWKGN